MRTARLPTVSPGIPGPMSGEWVLSPLWTSQPHGHTYHPDIPIPSPRHAQPSWYQRYPQKGHGTRVLTPLWTYPVPGIYPPLPQTHPAPLVPEIPTLQLTDRNYRKHYLPATSFAGGNNWCVKIIGRNMHQIYACSSSWQGIKSLIVEVSDV